MADLNGGKGKFWGVDGNVQYADSFVGATKVAEKVKKGGTETKSDGYVVDAIDIDWGGLKLTTIADQWSWGLHTASSTEQNAGKGDNTQGIHSTAYLLNKISSSFTTIYNEIGGDDNAGLRNKIKVLESSIEQITGSKPGQLADIRDRIQKIEKELDNPGATNALVTILDTLDGFDKNKKGDVKDYIDKHDEALLGTPTDEATAYTVYGVRKYVDTTAKDNLIGASTDAATANTIWGAKNYANITVKNSLLGATGDQWPTKQTIWGVKKYADEVKSASYSQAKVEAGIVLGAKRDKWPEQKTVYGVANYVDTTAKENLIGKEGDEWSAQKTLYGVVKYSDTKNADLKKILIGTSTDTTIDTHYGLKHILIGNTADTSIDTHWGVKNSLIGTSTDAATADTIWGAKKYADDVKTKLIGNTADTTINTHWGVKNSLLGKDGDQWPTNQTLYGVAKYAYNQASISYSMAANFAIAQAIEYTNQAIGTAESTLIGTSYDSINTDTIYGVRRYAYQVASNVLGKDGDLWSTQHTVYGVAKYAEIQTRLAYTNALNNAVDEAKVYTNTEIGRLEDLLIGASADVATADTIWGAKNYADNKVKELYATVDSTGGSHVAVQVVEEDGKVKTVTVTESNFDYEHITGADNKTLKETLENRDLAVSASLTELDGRLDKAVQASVIVEDGENVLVLGAIS